ncbi:MAG TPA: hypothetical protein DHW82_00440 [Spirochaetia bacterium]|nr:MAG: hypothetical protein A2Y41_07195 [Spirochaetes bacterium GWB1_36_13]HCL55467.1 hypothetical protein [Spirochaetia bacterium]
MKKDEFSEYDVFMTKFILERDQNTCQFCLRPADEAHHIFTRAFKSVRFEEMNLVSVCRECHTLIHAGKIGKKEIEKRMVRKYGSHWSDQLEEKAGKVLLWAEIKKNAEKIKEKLNGSLF